MSSQTNRPSVLDRIKKVIALLESEMDHVHALTRAGFNSRPDLIARVEVVRRFGNHLSDISDWLHLSLERLNDALKEAESVLGGLKVTQVAFLKKVCPFILANRLKTLGREPWFSYRRAQALADGMDEFLILAKGNTPLSELRSSYLELEKKFQEAESISAIERVGVVLSPPPPKHRKGRRGSKVSA